MRARATVNAMRSVAVTVTQKVAPPDEARPVARARKAIPKVAVKLDAVAAADVADVADVLRVKPKAQLKVKVKAVASVLMGK